MLPTTQPASQPASQFLPSLALEGIHESRHLHNVRNTVLRPEAQPTRPMGAQERGMSRHAVLHGTAEEVARGAHVPFRWRQVHGGGVDDVGAEDDDFGLVIRR